MCIQFATVPAILWGTPGQRALRSTYLIGAMAMAGARLLLSRSCCSQAPATTEIIENMGMMGRPFQNQIAEKDYRKKSRMKVNIDSKRQGTNYRLKIDNVSL